MRAVQTFILGLCLLASPAAWSAKSNKCVDIFKKSDRQILREENPMLAQIGSNFGEFMRGVNLSRQLPENLTLVDRSLALMVLNSEESALPFIKNVIASYSGKKLGDYFIFMIKAGVTGEKVILFEESIGQDLEFGYEVVEHNDRSFLDEVVGPEAPTSPALN